MFSTLRRLLTSLPLSLPSATCFGCFRCAIGAIDCRCALKMNPSVALPPAHRLTDLLSSGLGSGVKSKRKPMDQPRTDEDRDLVARTQAGDAAAFDNLV